MKLFPAVISLAVFSCLVCNVQQSDAKKTHGLRKAKLSSRVTALEETLCATSNATIRLSGQMASLVDTIKAVGEKVNKTDAEGDNLMAKTAAMAGKIDSMEKKLNAMAPEGNNLIAKTAAMAGKIDSLEKKLNAMASNNNRTVTVAFSAFILMEEEPAVFIMFLPFRHTTDGPHLVASEGSIVRFRGVITNTAGAYNPSTSKFTAPVDGDYFFTVHADVSPKYRGFSVTLNEREAFAAGNDGSDGHVTGSGLLKLKAGDTVAVTHYKSGGLVYAGRESTFTGFLVK